MKVREPGELGPARLATHRMRLDLAGREVGCLAVEPRQRGDPDFVAGPS
jgi:hypothetical protein